MAASRSTHSGIILGPPPGPELLPRGRLLPDRRDGLRPGSGQAASAVRPSQGQGRPRGLGARRAFQLARVGRRRLHPRPGRSRSLDQPRVHHRRRPQLVPDPVRQGGDLLGARRVRQPGPLPPGSPAADERPFPGPMPAPILGWNDHVSLGADGSLGHDSLDIAASVEDAKDENRLAVGVEEDHVRSNHELRSPEAISSRNCPSRGIEPSSGTQRGFCDSSDRRFVHPLPRRWSPISRPGRLWPRR